MRFAKFNIAVGALAAFFLIADNANAAFCASNGGRFNEWKRAFKAENQGRYKASTWKKFDALSYNKRVISLDRNQKSFKMSFDAFYRKRAAGLDRRAKGVLKKYKRYFDKAEQRYGVQREVIAAIWGLETAFGAYKGKPMPILQSVATLSYDCRRSAFFTKELLAALTIMDRGIADLSRRGGAWAGELGQTQFLPSSYLFAAVDFDGGGIDVWNSPGDVIGSTANWLAKKGWQRGGSYQPGGPNYRVIQAWNRATVYQKTIAKLAGLIAR